LSEDVTSSSNLRQYTGKYDSLADLRKKTYPSFERQSVDAA
jgi:nitrogenase molybdenum-iron protein alpha chain